MMSQHSLFLSGELTFDVPDARVSLPSLQFLYWIIPPGATTVLHGTHPPTVQAKTRARRVVRWPYLFL